MGVIESQERRQYKPLRMLFCITPMLYTPRMDTPKKKTGRPPLPPEKRLQQRSIRLPPELWAKIDANGLAWLRDVVRKARPKRDLDATQPAAPPGA